MCDCGIIDERDGMGGHCKQIFAVMRKRKLMTHDSGTAASHRTRSSLPTPHRLPVFVPRAAIFAGRLSSRSTSVTKMAASSGGGGPVNPGWSFESSASVSDANLELSLLGKWGRQPGESKGAVEFLVAHGMTEEEAEARSTARYSSTR